MLHGKQAHGAHSSHIIFMSLNVLQVQCNRVLSGVRLVHIADTVGGQVDLPILLVWQLILSKKKQGIVSLALYISGLINSKGRQLQAEVK